MAITRTNICAFPIIWGPSYASGLAVSGSLGRFDYAAEMKNAALASRPESWSITQTGFEHPTFSGRAGFRPNEMWNLGLSASAGPYFRSEVAPTLPVGRSIGDYNELVLAQDLSFAWHHLQLWAEFYEARFEVPRIGNADTFSYYFEAKYKITPQLFGALRWNQQLFGTIRDVRIIAQSGATISGASTPPSAIASPITCKGKCNTASASKIPRRKANTSLPPSSP